MGYRLKNRNSMTAFGKISFGLAVVMLLAIAASERVASEARAAQPNRSATSTQRRPAGSGLPVPRFVSLKSDRVNLRGGPGTDHRILWVFRRAGLPVEVVKEYQGWRQIRDAEGGTGWVYGALLSGRRTALVLPWQLTKDNTAQTELRESGSATAKTLAFIQAGVIASVLKCTGQWCEVAISNVRGFINQKMLWGVYPNEQFK